MDRVSRAESIETRYGWVVIAASTLMVSVAFGSTYLVTVALKPIAVEFDWPRWVPSAAYGMALVGAGFGGIAMGWWADRRSIWEPAVLGAVMIGVGCILAGHSGGIVSLLAVHLLLIGFLGNGTTFSPLLTNATRWFDRRRGLAVAIVASGQSLAGAVWPPAFGWGIANYGWRDTMIGYGVLAIAIMLPLTLVLRRRPPVALERAVDRAPAEGQPRRVLGLGPNLVLGIVFVAIIGCCVAMAMPMVHIVAYCSDLGFDPARGAEMLSVLLACAFISKISFGWLADRIGGLKTILIGASLQAVMLSCYAWTETLAGLYIVSALFGLVFGGIVPAYALVVRELFPAREAGWRIGVVFLGGTLGMAAGSVLGGGIFDLTGSYQTAFLTGVAFNIVNLAMIGILVYRQSDTGPSRPARRFPADQQAPA